MIFVIDSVWQIKLDYLTSFQVRSKCSVPYWIIQSVTNPYREVHDDKSHKEHQRKK